MLGYGVALTSHMSLVGPIVIYIFRYIGRHTTEKKGRESKILCGLFFWDEMKNKINKIKPSFAKRDKFSLDLILDETEI